MILDVLPCKVYLIATYLTSILDSRVPAMAYVPLSREALALSVKCVKHRESMGLLVATRQGLHNGTDRQTDRQKTAY